VLRRDDPRAELRPRRVAAGQDLRADSGVHRPT
jgi:hypothetical protein